MAAQGEQLPLTVASLERPQSVHREREAVGAQDAIPGCHQGRAREHVDAEALVVLDPVVAQLDAAGQRIGSPERGTNAEHDLLDGHGAIAVDVGGVAVVERAALHRDADDGHQLVDGDVHVLVAVAGRRHPYRDAAQRGWRTARCR